MNNVSIDELPDDAEEQGKHLGIWVRSSIKTSECRCTSQLRFYAMRGDVSVCSKMSWLRWSSSCNPICDEEYRIIGNHARIDPDSYRARMGDEIIALTVTPIPARTNRILSSQG